MVKKVKKVEMATAALPRAARAKAAPQPLQENPQALPLGEGAAHNTLAVNPLMRGPSVQNMTLITFTWRPCMLKLAI